MMMRESGCAGRGGWRAEAGGSFFRARFDTPGLELQVGLVEEFHDDIIEERQRAIAAQANYEIVDHNMILYGICATCKEQLN